MPCAKCKANFTLINWKVKCIECMLYHCLRCLNKSNEGLCCEKCGILNKRPPDREKLMELRSKDLRDYLNKRHISTHGLVEKAELVELFCRCSNPASGTRSRSRLGSVVSGSVPNLASPSQEPSRNNIFTNFSVRNVINNLGRRVEQTGNFSSNSSPRASTFQVHSFTNSVNSQFGNPQTSNRPAPFFTLRSATNLEQEDQTTTTNVQQPNSTQNTTTQQPVPPPPEPPKYPKLSDFNTIEELNDLSVKQLKELLTLNRVTYKGCVEKSELLDRATRLWTDNNLHKDEDYEAATVENLCKICMDGPLDCVILECGHLATCINCGKKLAECPICRQYVTRVVRTFKV